VVSVGTAVSASRCSRSGVTAATSVPSLTAAFFGAAGCLAAGLGGGPADRALVVAGLVAVGCGSELMATGAERALLTAGAGVRGGDRLRRLRAVDRDVLRLDGAGGDDRGGGEAGGGLRGQRARARPAARCRRRRPRRPTRHPRRGGAAAGRGGRAEVREQRLLEQQQRRDREDRGERLVGLAQLLAERGAAIAGAQVPADGRARAAQPLGDLAQLVADLLAGQQPRLGGLGERDPRRAPAAT
jgi:hypothetical protein